MFLRATHTTRYQYEGESFESHNEVRLMPHSDAAQRLISFRLDVEPFTQISSYHNIGGTVHHFDVRAPHRVLEIRAVSEVETTVTNPFLNINLIEPDVDWLSKDEVRSRYAEYLTESRYVQLTDEVRAIAHKVSHRGILAELLLGLNEHLFRSLSYDPDVTHVHSTVEEVLELGGGVCQDYAHVMIAVCRTLGIPARYVSGYLYSDKFDGLRGEAATHAWVEALIGPDQWLGIDPTNNVLANDHHIKVHIGRDYADVTPIKGVFKGFSDNELSVAVKVEQLPQPGAQSQTQGSTADGITWQSQSAATVWSTSKTVQNQQQAQQQQSRWAKS